MSKILAVTVMDRLEALGACSESLDWISLNRLADANTLWTTCIQPTWMMWVIFRKSPVKSPERMKFLKLLVELGEMTFHGESVERVAISAVKKYCADDDYTAAALELQKIVDSVNRDDPSFFILAQIKYLALDDETVRPNNAGFFISRVKRTITKSTCLEIILKHYPEPPNV